MAITEQISEFPMDLYLSIIAFVARFRDHSVLWKH